ncbi:1-deoxy-D-xylulose-5-phosphate synthase [Aureivirga marina]|uniref:1-deoxy-D-xylulose-5-phosphate synthase n=1 Tax=Aureivirga marina TaxID=1182451 RepID=UPI0018CA3B22|nr:1-deoxy-D-xylulose-5-phosphate synthase [Aureivirga marina]
MERRILEHIKEPKDIRNFSVEELTQLATELREFIIEIVASKEGHLGASLGVVELTIALHYCFKTPEDLLVWDVGHQAYGHKILTGRKEQFHTNRQFGGIAGFPKIAESIYDAFGVGHSSTSISAILGMALASKLKGETEKHHIAVIGDASIVSGMSLEALNHLGETNANVLVVLNDNSIGIDPSVGALKHHFENISSIENSANSVFESFNIPYFGVVDGHDISTLLEELEEIKKIKGPKILHVKTVKGKGLRQAEANQVKYHAPGKFDSKTGDLFPKKIEASPIKYQEVFGKTILELAKKNAKIVAITPAMPTGSSLTYMMEEFPERAIDVGISEEHAVTLAAGFATQGMIPYCVIYSTFLQRSYDQIIHDVALQNLPVIFCIDRAGLVGEDGPTHHGVFDIAYLRLIPNMTIFAPMDEIALRNMLFTSQLGIESPLAIRYPRGLGEHIHWEKPFEKIEIGKGRCLQEGSEIAVLTIGNMGNSIKRISKKLPKGKVAHYDMQFVKPLDKKLLHEIFQKFGTIITIEDGTIVGGFGSAILEFMNENSYQNKKCLRLGIPDEFVTHGKINDLQKVCGIDDDSILQRILEVL